MTTPAPDPDPALVTDLDLVRDPGTGLTPADRRRAALAVCSYAESTEQARDLLETLGLLDDVRGDRLLVG